MEEADVPFSPNAANLLAKAKELAIEKGHEVVSTEHFIYELCRQESRAITWIAEQSFPDQSNPVEVFCQKTVEWVENRPLFQESKETTITDPPFSEALTEVIECATKIGSAPVVDGDYVHEDGLIASEFLVAGLLVEGTNVGAQALTIHSEGKVNSFTLLEAINVDPVNILSDESEGSWQEFTIEGKAPRKQLKVKPVVVAWVPDGNLRLENLPRAPTNGSNWLIPGRLIIGEHPGKGIAKKLVDEGVSTFVSLIGEYKFDEYKTKYPNECKSNTTQRISFIHYPIRDFSVTEPENLIRLIKLLKRRLLQGEVVFIHCRGGHGRTGMVAIPLLCSIYDISVKEAQTYVLKSTTTTRENDKAFAYWIQMPETNEQMNVVHAAVPLLEQKAR